MTIGRGLTNDRVKLGKGSRDGQDSAVDPLRSSGIGFRQGAGQARAP